MTELTDVDNGTYQIMNEETEDDYGTFTIISSCPCMNIEPFFNLIINRDTHTATHKKKHSQTGCTCSRNEKRTVQKEKLIEALPDIPNDLTNIIFDYIGTPFIVVLHPGKSQNIVIPYISSTNGLKIDWDDGTWDTCVGTNFSNVKHECEFDRDYIVHIYGNITDISFKNTDELCEISQWGSTSITNGFEVFSCCSNFESISAIDIPNLSHCTIMMGMFINCVLFNGDLSKWDVSNVTNMTRMFISCKLFNCDLSKWNVSNVTDMALMFCDCKTFNRDLSTWNVSKVIDMSNMFRLCNSFNRDLSRWGVSNVTNMREMFNGCKSFKRDLSKWNVSNVTDMESMFSGCRLFNSDVSKWKVSNVTDMESMFSGCRLFNSDVSEWNVSNVTNMKKIFKGCNSFSCNLSKWNKNYFLF